MAATYEPIASTTVGTATNSVTFTSITSGYTDLVAVYAAAENSTVSAGLLLRFNSDSGSNYSQTSLYGTGSAAGSTRLSSETYIRPGRYLDFRGRQIGVVNFMSYANTNVYKTILCSVANNETPNTSAIGVSREVGLWRNTAAISSIEFIASGASNFASGSTFSIYGVLAA